MSMKKSTYKSKGKTPKDAFVGIWELMQYTDDACLRKDKEGNYEIRIVILRPTAKEREEFER